MATDTAPLTLGVQRLAREHNVKIDIGTITFGPQGQLAVASARPRFEGYLAKVVADVNAQEKLTIKVPPPEGAKPFSFYTLTVPRTAPDLLGTIREYLEQNFDLLLVGGTATAPSAEGAAEPQATEPEPPPEPPPPSPLELMRAAITNQDRAGVQANLLALGIDQADADRIVAAWNTIADPAVHVRQRLAKMPDLIAVIKALKVPKTARDELWRLQKMLTRYT
jgi:hypothetical protein